MSLKNCELKRNLPGTFGETSMSNKEIHPAALSKASLSDLLVQRETGIIATWIDSYSASRLTFKRETTRSTYTIILRQFLTWLLHQPGHESPFDPLSDLTGTAIQ